MKTPDLFTSNFAEIAIVYSHRVTPAHMLKISSSRDAYEAMSLLMNGQMDHVEYFYVILVNRANKVLGYHLVSKGGLSGTVVDPKIVFQVALKSCASGVLLVHNHPSGNLQPSEADLKLTQRLKQAGLIMEIPVLDHLIISCEGYYSFADEGRL